MATKPDRELAASMEGAVDSLFGKGAYAELNALHPERAALVGFFSSLSR